jgi:hypothetical protein
MQWANKRSRRNGSPTDTQADLKTPNYKRVVYYESIKRKLKTIYIWGCRCYERLQPNTKEFKRLAYTELVLIPFVRFFLFDKNTKCRIAGSTGTGNIWSKRNKETKICLQEKMREEEVECCT